MNIINNISIIPAGFLPTWPSVFSTTILTRDRNRDQILELTFSWVYAPTLSNCAWS